MEDAIKSVSGDCLCGNIRVEVSKDELFEDDNKIHIGVCHCDTCRKINAGPMFFIGSLKKENFRIIGKSYLSYYESSLNARRLFCSNCGTYIGFNNINSGSISFNPELFSSQLENILLENQIWYQSKPDYYEFKNNTEIDDFES